MTPDLRDLARDVVAIPGWKWLPGMLVNVAGLTLRARRADDVLPWLTTAGEVRAYPDLTDPATCGVLLDLLGPDGPAAGWDVNYDDEGRCAVSSYSAGVTGVGRTLGEACCRVAVAMGRWPGRQP